MKLKGIEIEPGMVIETYDGFYVAFPTKIPSYSIGFVSIKNGGWISKMDETCILSVRDLAAEKTICSGKILWDKRSQPIEVSMEEIAKKFNISVEQLRIKKE